MVHHYLEDVEKPARVDKSRCLKTKRAWGWVYGVPYKYGRQVEAVIRKLNSMPDDSPDKKLALEVQSQMQCIVLQMHMDSSNNTNNTNNTNNRKTAQSAHHRAR